MAIPELRTANETSTKESDESVTELSSGIGRFPSGGVAPAALQGTPADSAGVESFHRFFQAAPSAPMLILREAHSEASSGKIVRRGAQECAIKIPAYALRSGDGAHDDG
jgi:hypothetical protein